MKSCGECQHFSICKCVECSIGERCFSKGTCLELLQDNTQIPVLDNDKDCHLKEVTGA